MNNVIESPLPVVEKTKNVVRLTKTGLMQDKENGTTIPEMAKKYGLPVATMRKALKQAGIEIKARQKAKFIIEE